MDEKKRQLLTALAEELKTEEDFEEVSFFSAEEQGAPMDTVRAVISDLGAELISVLGEFFFLPFRDTEVLYFTTVITLTDEIEEDEKADLSAAVSRINYALPCGCFALGEGGDSLIYRLTVPILSDLEEGAVKTLMLTSIRDAVLAADSFEAYLMLVLEGNLSADQMMELIRGREERDE